MRKLLMGKLVRGIDCKEVIYVLRNDERRNERFEKE